MFLRDHVYWACISTNLLHWEQYLCLPIQCFLGNGEPFHTSSLHLVFISYVGILAEVFDHIYFFFFSFFLVTVNSLFLVFKECGFAADLSPHFFSDWSQSSKQYFLIFQVFLPLYVCSFQVSFLYLLFFTILIHFCTHSVQLNCYPSVKLSSCTDLLKYLSTMDTFDMVSDGGSSLLEIK